MRLFAIATLPPVVLIAAACIWGGIWVLAAVAYLSALAAGLDEAVQHITPPRGRVSGGHGSVRRAGLVAFCAALSGDHRAKRGCVRHIGKTRYLFCIGVLFRASEQCKRP